MMLRRVSLLNTVTRSFQRSLTLAPRRFCTDVGGEQQSEAGRVKGVVKWFDPKKGFGFVSSEEDGQDYFVHFSSIEGQQGHRSLEDGDKVEFEAGQDARTGKTVAKRVTGEG